MTWSFRRQLHALSASYFHFLVSYPGVIQLATLAFVLICFGLGLGLQYGPSYIANCFSNTTAGFEVRGTKLSGQMLQTRALTKALQNGKLTLKRTKTGFVEKEKRKRRSSSSLCLSLEECSSDSCSFFIVQSSTSSNLLELDNLLEICDAKQELQSEQCSDTVWTIADAIAGYNNKTCVDLTENDIANTVLAMRICHSAYVNKLFGPYCTEDMCPHLPPKCNTQAIDLYTMLFYFTDSVFQEALTSSRDPKLPHSAIVESGGLASVDFYNKLSNRNFNLQKHIKIHSLYLGPVVYEKLFNYYMAFDMLLFAIALVLIVTVMYIYLQSFNMVLATSLSILFAFLISYFVYHFVLQFNFFPFLNILVLLLLIAVGADSVFVFCDAWKNAKVEYSLLQKTTSHKGLGLPANGTRVKSSETQRSISDAKFKQILANHVIPAAFKHAGKSILVTSLTTAGAFASNFSSKIIVIRCFGMFGMVGILINFVLMVTWIPAFIVQQEISERKCCQCLSSITCSCISKVKAFCCKRIKEFFSQILPRIVCKIWYVWFVMFIAAGVGGILVVFVTPKLKMPSYPMVPYYPSENPLEKFRNRVETYRFSQVSNEDKSLMSVSFIWGVSSVDNSNHADPNSEAELQFVEFDMSSEETQKGIQSFCSALKWQPWLEPSQMNTTCLMDDYTSALQMQCSLEGALSSPCCGLSNNEVYGVFEKCFHLYMSSPHLGPDDSTLGSPIFEGNSVKVFTYSVHTTQIYTVVYEEVDEWIKTMEMFFYKYNVIKGSGFFYAAVDFYALQRELSSGMWLALGISLALSSLILLVTVMNVLITIYAVFCITLTIFSAISVLVLIGWELSIVESAILTLAVGLSIDFIIHYAVAYVGSSATEPSKRVKESFRRVGSSVTMAAFTTFCAGAMLMSSHILAYQQLGIFLMLIMSVAILFASFLFQAMCSVIGPRGNFLQITCRPKKAASEEEPKMTSVQTLSNYQVNGAGASNLSPEFSSQMHRAQS